MIVYLRTYSSHSRVGLSSHYQTGHNILAEYRIVVKHKDVVSSSLQCILRAPIVSLSVAKVLGILY